MVNLSVIYICDIVLINFCFISECLQKEKDIKEQKSKLESLENMFKMMEQKLLKVEERERQKDNNITLLKQEVQLLKLNSSIDANEQAEFNPNQNSKHQPASTPKMPNEWISTNTIHSSMSEEDNPENDIYFD